MAETSIRTLAGKGRLAKEVVARGGPGGGDLLQLTRLEGEFRFGQIQGFTHPRKWGRIAILRLDCSEESACLLGDHVPGDLRILRRRQHRGDLRFGAGLLAGTLFLLHWLAFEVLGQMDRLIAGSDLVGAAEDGDVPGPRCVVGSRETAQLGDLLPGRHIREAVGEHLQALAHEPVVQVRGAEPGHREQGNQHQCQGQHHAQEAFGARPEAGTPRAFEQILAQAGVAGGQVRSRGPGRSGFDEAAVVGQAVGVGDDSLELGPAAAFTRLLQFEVEPAARPLGAFVEGRRDGGDFERRRG